VLEEIAAENGLLKEQARHWYGFLHLTLQEYFVALYVVDHQELNTLIAHLGDSWWEEDLKFVQSSGRMLPAARDLPKAG
jgi:predicted NACHT family NTPase